MLTFPHLKEQSPQKCINIALSDLIEVLLLLDDFVGLSINIRIEIWNQFGDVFFKRRKKQD